MATKTRTQQSSIKILEDVANFADSEKIAEKNKGRLITLREVIIGLRQDPTLLDRIKSNSYWVYADRETILGTKEYRNHYEIDYENGVLNPVSEGVWNLLPVEKRANVIPGGDFSFVYLDISVKSDRRFEIDDINSGSGCASRVMYVANEKEGLLKRLRHRD